MVDRNDNELMYYSNMIERYKNGLKDAARFAIQPNMWGYCGENTSQEILRNYVSDKEDNSEIVRETLHSHGFPHLNSFLETISEALDLDIFDDEVVMSYWFGSFLTEKVGTGEKDKLVNNYGENISGDFAKSLSEILPEEIYLTHLSQVALVAAAGYNQKEKTTLINHCMIAYGKVLEMDINKKTAIVQREVLRKNDGLGYRISLAKQNVKIDSDLTPTVAVGDEVTVHLGYLAATISSDQAERLKYWTRKVSAVI